MWPSRELATSIYDWANAILIVGLVVGVVSTALIVWMGGVKERYTQGDLAETNEKAARAMERAAELELEAEKARLETMRLKRHVSWRTVTPEQRAILILKLSDHDVTVWTSFVGDDPEATNFREDIDEALQAAGVETKFFSGWARAVGLKLWHEETPAHDALLNALLAAELPVEPEPRSENGLDGLVLIVGSKPPPPHQLR